MPGLRCAIHQPNFFPRLSTLTKLYAADVWIILDDVQFNRDYQHRCHLPAADPGTARRLTVPMHLPDGRPTLIKDARTADPALTARRMRRMLGQYFRRSPHRTAISDLLAEAENAVVSSRGVWWHHAIRLTGTHPSAFGTFAGPFGPTGIIVPILE